MIEDSKLSVRLTQAQRDDLFATAAYLDRSPSWCVRQAVEVWLRRQETDAPRHVTVRDGRGSEPLLPNLLRVVEQAIDLGPVEARFTDDGVLVQDRAVNGSWLDESPISLDEPKQGVVLTPAEVDAYHARVQQLREEAPQKCSHPVGQRIRGMCVSCGADGL